MSNIAMWWKNSLHFTLFGGRLLTAFHSKDKQEFDHFYNVFVESLYDISESVWPYNCYQQTPDPKTIERFMS